MLSEAEEIVFGSSSERKARRRRIMYGPRWRELNRFVRTHKNLLRCEYCGRSPVTLHHIVPGSERHYDPEVADDPHFMMLLCSSCHWYTTRCPGQPFEKERLAEWDRFLNEKLRAKREVLGERGTGK